MEAVAWVGALETAIGILYLALIGQRSIAQWLDDRRSRNPTATTAGQETPQELLVTAASASPRIRTLSVQSIGKYLEYVWRDPLEAALITGKALTLGSVLFFGTATLLLLLGALVIEAVAYFSGSRELDQVAQSIAGAGGSAVLIAVFSGFAAALDILALTGLAESRKNEQERLEAEARRARAYEARGTAQRAEQSRRRGMERE